jgi:6-phosphogluconolactonase
MAQARVLEEVDAAAVARRAAEEVAARAAAAIAARGTFTLALAGGSTPRALYMLLADPAGPFRAAVPWGQVEIWFGDERNVAPDHADSNFRMADEALLRHVAPAAVHRMEGERDAAEAAERYEAELVRRFGPGPPPRLDLVLLGLGPDGHTASLFPGTAELDERRRWVAAPWVRTLSARRITLTFPVLDAAAAVLFVVAGEGKRDAVRRMLTPPPGKPLVPAARVRPVSGDLLVVADAAALHG